MFYWIGACLALRGLCLVTHGTWRVSPQNLKILLDLWGG